MLLVLAVAAVHGCATRRLVHHVAALKQAEPMPPRMQAVYVRSMESAPPVTLAVAAPPPRPLARRMPPRPAPEPVADIASAPDAEPPAAGASAPEPEAPRLADADSPETLPTQAASEASAPWQPEPVASAAADGTPVFEWPTATRLSYVLTGNYRGEVHGSAQVEWLREADRYQVHLDVVVGLSVAPLMSRRMSSEGLVTGQGLAPRRYDQQTKLAFNEPRRSTVLMGPDGVRLANGGWRERWPGLQDTASQFVQLAWLLSTRAELARAGATVEMPLALPRNVDRVLYDVLEPETQHTSFGEIQVLHLKPRRVARADTDMTVELWLAPQFRYLPVRAIIRQDADTFVDLAITRPPELAAPAP